jgi:hypothetical protein
MPPLLEPELPPLELALPLDDPLLPPVSPFSPESPPPLPPLLLLPHAPTAIAALSVRSEANAHPRTLQDLSISFRLAGRAYAGFLVCY